MDVDRELRSHLRRILEDRDIACVAGEWYMIVPLSVARPEEAWLALKAADGS